MMLGPEDDGVELAKMHDKYGKMCVFFKEFFEYVFFLYIFAL